MSFSQTRLAKIQKASLMITWGKDIVRESGCYHYLLGKPSGSINVREVYKSPFSYTIPFTQQSRFESLPYASKETNI